MVGHRVGGHADRVVDHQVSGGELDDEPLAIEERAVRAVAVHQDDRRGGPEAERAPVDRGAPILRGVGDVDVDRDVVAGGYRRAAHGGPRRESDLADVDLERVHLPGVGHAGEEADVLAIELDQVSLRLNVGRRRGARIDVEAGHGQRRRRSQHPGRDQLVGVGQRAVRLQGAEGAGDVDVELDGPRRPIDAAGVELVAGVGDEVSIRLLLRLEGGGARAGGGGAAPHGDRGWVAVARGRLATGRRQQGQPPHRQG